MQSRFVAAFRGAAVAGALLACAAAVAPAHAQDFDKLIPTEASGSPARLVPMGWKVLARAEGQFVGDAQPDMALVLEDLRQATIVRVLVVAERASTDYWVRRELASSVLDRQPRTQISLRVEKGVLLLEQAKAEPGAKRKTILLMRFREEPKNGLRLIGRDITDLDDAGKLQDKTSVNYLSGVEENTAGGKTTRDKFKLKGKTYLTDAQADLEWSNMR